MHNRKPKRVGSIKPESTSKLSKRLHLDSLAWLLEREVFEPKLATGLHDVLAVLKESSGKDENDDVIIMIEQVFYPLNDDSFKIANMS